MWDSDCPDSKRTAYVGSDNYAGGVKSRLELETEVGSAEVLSGILSQLGFSPAFRYDKRRTTWRFAEPSRPEVVVDETPLGLFAEIEGRVAEQPPDSGPNILYTCSP